MKFYITLTVHRVARAFLGFLFSRISVRLARATDRLAVNCDSYATSRRVMSAVQDALGFRVVAGDSLIQIFENYWTAGLMRAWIRQLYLIWRRNTRQALTANLRSILGVRWGCSVHSATYCGLVIGRAARPRGSMRPSSNRSDAAVVPVVAVVVSSGVGDRSRLSGSIVLVLRCGGVLAPYKVRSAAPAEGLPRARRPESVERRRRGAFRCPLLRVPVPQRVAFSGSALAKPAPSRDSRVRRLRAGVVRAMRAIPGWPGILSCCLLVPYRPLATIL